jgi:mycoredoxin
MRNFIFVVLALAAFQYWGPITEFYSSPASGQLASNADVVMYGAKWCGYCAEARKLFRSKGVAFQEFDVEQSSSARRQFESLGGGGVPLIVIDEQVIHGFDRRRILAALGGR